MSREGQVFNQQLLNDAIKPISGWTRFRLLFRPTNYSKDGSTTIWFKELNGAVVITRIKYCEP